MTAAPNDRLPESAPYPPPLQATWPAEPGRTRLPLVRVDSIRALVALATGLSVTAYLYTRSQLPIVILVGFATITFDRVLGMLVEAAKSIVKAWRRPRPEPDPPRRLPAQGREPHPDLRRTAPVGDGRSAPPAVLRPVAFVAESRLGALPWRLPRFPGPSGVAADQALLGDLEVRAASVVGPAHRADPRKARYRQDAYRLAPGGRGKFLVVAVADGVSNAVLADEGANRAARLAVGRIQDELERCPDLEQLRADQVFPEVADQLTKLATRWQRNPAELATTLIAAVVPVVSRDPRGRRIWLGSLADSSAWRLGGGWQHLAGQVKADYDPNALNACLPLNPKRATHELHWLPHGESLALMTDGLSDLLVDVEGAAEELHRRWAAPPTLPELVRDMSFDAPGQDDDRTVVLVWTPERIRAAS